MLDKLKELNDQPYATAEEDNPMDILDWCVDHSIDALNEIKVYAECGNPGMCSQLAIRSTSSIKQLYIKYLEQCKIMAALRGNLDLANADGDDYYVTYAGDIDELENPGEDEEDDLSNTFLSAINGASQSPEDKPEEFDNSTYLVRGIKRAILSLGEIEIMGSYGRAAECAREAVEAVDRINELRGKFNDATRIILEI